MPKISVIVALWTAFMVGGCYGSNEVKDGQSHWLRLCDAPSDCSQGLICACGVCSVACAGGAACGQHGTCAVLADIAQCSAVAPVEQACLQRCREPDDCGASGIECVDGLCVASTSAEAPIEDGGAPADRDATVGTIDQLSERKSCRPGGVFAGCELGEICHIDDTCMQRATSDENGVETLAIGKHMAATGEPSAWGSIVDVALTDDAIYWLDVGSSALDTIPPTDSAIFRLRLATSEETMLPAEVTYLADELFADAELAYYHQGGDLRVVDLGDQGRGYSASIGSSMVRAAWTVGEPTDIYYAQAGTSRIRQLRVSSDIGEGDLRSFGDDRQVVGLALHERTLFVETNLYLEDSTTLHTLHLDGGEPTVLIETFRHVDAAASRMLVHGGEVFWNDVGGVLRGYDIGSGTLSTYAERDATLRSASEDSVYFVYHDADGPSDYMIMQASVVTGETSVLLTTPHEVGDVIERDDQLFWVEHARLLRKRIASTLE